VLYWLSVGAQPSEPVARLLEKSGTKARFERMKKGETVEVLAAEAAAAKAAAGPQNMKTRRPAPVGKPKADIAAEGDNA